VVKRITEAAGGVVGEAAAREGDAELATTTSGGGGVRAARTLAARAPVRRRCSAAAAGGVVNDGTRGGGGIGKGGWEFGTGGQVREERARVAPRPDCLVSGSAPTTRRGAARWNGAELPFRRCP
jgi:hypothetical protein